MIVECGRSRTCTPSAPPRARSGQAILGAGDPVEVERKVDLDGLVHLAVAPPHRFALAGRTITLRLDGHPIHAIADSGRATVRQAAIPGSVADGRLGTVAA